MHVVIIHPDLGIGGAERLVVDAAVAMQQNGHQVQFVTNHYDPKHSFSETPKYDIKIVDVFPRSIFGSGYALCSYIRMCIAALYVCIFLKKTELVFCDSVSSCLLIFRIFRLLGLFSAPVIFYCHYPDQLLTDRKGMAKKLYRIFIDSFETWTMTMADSLCVNSQFTKEVVNKTFPSLRGRRLNVLYPTLNTKFFDNCETVDLNEIPSEMKHVFLSINRYERKKNIALALEAFDLLKRKISEVDYQGCFLIIAGGYDLSNEENIAHFVELENKAAALNLSKEQYLFLKSPSDHKKLSLLKRALAVLYTSSNEHFGIVPIEAMYMRCCVIAPNSGGPRETIVDQETGFLVDPDANSFAEKMAELVDNSAKAMFMGDAGRKRVRAIFTMDNFANRLETLMKEAVSDFKK
ncbi:unnamed protein product [Thelazia callipaeda]|uniref:Alpha-1,3/1,6-mannosyltransferase ALG2 n=1 Tax=Thelazia callipaeda TaxID=103827 RepID=A0A0N5D3U7_THECL|nr:unnamed protein product [Thelazia callipaeda]